MAHMSFAELLFDIARQPEQVTSSIALSPGGERVAVCELESGAVHVLSRDGRTQSVLAPSDGGHTPDMTFLPDGTLVLLQGGLRLVPTSGPERMLAAHGRLLGTSPQRVAASPRGDRLAVTDLSAVDIVALPSGERVARHELPIDSLAFSDDGSRLAMYDGVALRVVHDQAVLQDVEIPQGRAMMGTAARFVDELVVAATDGGDVFLVGGDGVRAHHVLELEDALAHALVITRAGLVAAGDQSVRLFDARTGALVGELPGEGVDHLAVDVSGTVLSCAWADGRVTAWRLRG